MAICYRCGLSTKRSKVPIIWRNTEDGMNGRAVFCSVSCLERTQGRLVPEPLRSRMLAAEGKQ